MSSEGDPGAAALTLVGTASNHRGIDSPMSLRVLVEWVYAVGLRNFANSLRLDRVEMDCCVFGAGVLERRCRGLNWGSAGFMFPGGWSGGAIVPRAK